MQILDSSLNINFIQLSTRHDDFYFAQFNLIFFSVCMLVLIFVWLFKSHFISPIFYTSVTNTNSCFDYLFLIGFLVYFRFLRHCFQFSILTLSCLSSSTYIFSFLTTHFYYICTKMLKPATSFTPLYCGLPSKMSFLLFFSLFQLTVPLLNLFPFYLLFPAAY